MSKVYKEDIQYIVQEDKGNVIAIYPVDEYELAIECMMVEPDLMYQVDAFRGVARCTGEDTFSEKIGKKIAELKLVCKYRHHRARRLQMAAAKYRKIAEELEEKSVTELNALGKAQASLEQFLTTLEQ